MIDSERAKWQKVYRRAMSVCHPDRAPAHLRGFMEAKAKALNAAWSSGNVATIRKIAVELGVENVPPLPQSQKQERQSRSTPPPKQPTGGKYNYNAADDDGVTLLMAAVQQGVIGMVKGLLASGANPNAADKRGMTALMRAAYAGYAEIVKVLLVAGANPKACAKDGLNARGCAQMGGHANVVRILNAAEAGQSLDSVEANQSSAKHQSASSSKQAKRQSASSFKQGQQITPTVQFIKKLSKSVIDMIGILSSLLGVAAGFIIIAVAYSCILFPLMGRGGRACSSFGGETALVLICLIAACAVGMWIIKIYEEDDS